MGNAWKELRILAKRWAYDPPQMDPSNIPNMPNIPNVPNMPNIPNVPNVPNIPNMVSVGYYIIILQSTK